MNKSQGQTDSLGKQHSVVLEAGGSGGYWSMNYQYLSKKTRHIYMTLGLSVVRLNNFNGNFDPSMILSTSAGVLLGPGHHKLDLGVSYSVLSEVMATESFEPKREYRLNGGMYVGYRYSDPERNWFLKVYYLLVWKELYTFPPQVENWGGVGVGYSFK